MANVRWRGDVAAPRIVVRPVATVRPAYVATGGRPRNSGRLLAVKTDTLDRQSVVKSATIVTGVVLALLMGNVLNEVFALYFPVFQRFNMVEATVHWLTHTGGPFEVFTGNWTLIDV